MKRQITLVSLVCIIAGCITVPVGDESHSHLCKISSDRKTLKIVDIAEETNSYYSISGTLLSPILVPTTALISGSYVLVNNIYHYGEEKIVCRNKPSKT
ncbi:hypothetical protein RI844_11135 [Thalassotalea fonticola]|uniref:YceK/YidQ family lipoprotein n=1 Tax=Thalassotalea fonticola TaxID=3065649 RepID=A0ABZ0GJF5_9GAMM|nr:hypothetical protein RI844_11135 [Colwelliaceae bacterium S1-1]